VPHPGTADRHDPAGLRPGRRHARPALGLPCGELAELRRRDIDLETGIVRVSLQARHPRRPGRGRPPKSASGVRVVALPDVAVEALCKHMGQDGYVDEGPDALIVTGAKGKHLRGSQADRQGRSTPRGRAGWPGLGHPDNLMAR
jgi:integrase